MDQNKLHRAYEKARENQKKTQSEERTVSLDAALQRAVNQAQDSRRSTPATKPKPVKLAEPDRVYEDLVPNRPVVQSTADLSKLVNTHPMSVATMKKNKLIYSGMKNKAVLNAYRELRIKLKQKSDGSNATILISSASRKTESILTALNLAISYSLDQTTSALVVECNPYSDQLKGLVTTDFDLGLTDYVDQPDIGIDKIIYPTGIDRVSFIPPGSNHERAVELFSSNAMEALLYELKNRYPDRNIIVNTPPVLTTSEARVLTDYCDMTVLTVPHGRASMSDIEDAVSAIGSDHIAGVIYQQ